jgi:hypothetical protein
VPQDRRRTGLDINFGAARSQNTTMPQFVLLGHLLSDTVQLSGLFCDRQIS